jgi:hypothetical protein
MSKGQRIRTGRAEKQRRRQNRKARPAPTDLGPLGGGWHRWGFGDTDTEDLDFAAPDEALLDTSGCQAFAQHAGHRRAA